MLEEICHHLHNFFTARRGVHQGTYRVEDGVLDLPFLREGQYFRIVGSCLNDGVYRYPAEGLTDEVFFGEIWAMNVPRGLQTLAQDIAAWQQEHGAQAASPYQSEAFGGYEYRLREGLDGSAAWQKVFRRRLDRYRKLG